MRTHRYLGTEVRQSSQQWDGVRPTDSLWGLLQPKGCAILREDHDFVISQVEQEPLVLCLTGQACEGWHLRLVQVETKLRRFRSGEEGMVGRGLDSTDLSVQLPGAWSAASGGR